MNSMLNNVLYHLSEGLIMMDQNYKITFWNSYMEMITGQTEDLVIGKNIYEVLPNMKKDFIEKALKDVLTNGSNMFFSAAIHSGLISEEGYLNIRMCRMILKDDCYALIEVMDVTNQFIQKNILKKYVKELYLLNQELKEKEEEIKNLAYYDMLTGVANRTLFYELSRKFLNEAKESHKIFGLMFIDVDDFKYINDTYGHEVGDDILVKVANILTQTVGDNKLVVRYGGDEFLVMLPGLHRKSDYKETVTRIIQNKNNVIRYNHDNIRISFSIGVSFFPDDGETMDKLVGRADKSMYVAKNTAGEDICCCGGYCM